MTSGMFHHGDTAPKTSEELTSLGYNSLHPHFQMQTETLMDQRQGCVQYLPPISSNSSPFRSPTMSLQQAAPPISFPHLSCAATKAERYKSLTDFDKKGLKRSKGHVRNALKTTEYIDRIAKRLDERLKCLKGESKDKVSFNRLSVYREAFEEIIPTSGAFSPVLVEIKDMYNDYLEMALSQQETEHKEPVTEMPSTASIDSSVEPSDLVQLKKQLHHLEVESRVLLKENNRLREEMVKEKELYVKRKRRETANLEALKSQPASSQSSSTNIQDYATQVESLQLQIAEERQAISRIISERKGRIPLSVCHNLEQCLREVEIETQKCQRHGEHLRQEIEKWKGSLWEQLQSQGYKSDHFRGIWDTIITAQQ